MKILEVNKSSETSLKIDQPRQFAISQEFTKRITLPFSTPRDLASHTIEEISYLSRILNQCIKAIEPIIAMEMFLKTHYEWWPWTKRKLTITKKSHLAQKIPQNNEEAVSQPSTKDLRLLPLSEKDLEEHQKFLLPLPSQFWTQKHKKKQRKKKKTPQERGD